MSNTKRKPGVYFNLENDAYHKGDGISKSGLWTIHEKTPAHYKFPEEDIIDGTKQANLDFGHAAHIAILEPNDFEAKVKRGPKDRRGSEWKNRKEACALEGQTLLLDKDYDRLLAMRDSVHADQWINSIICGGEPEVEASGYWIDPDTGVLCRCRPDLYRKDLKVMIDLKSTLSAHPDAFARSVVNYGYHAQEAFYSDGYRELGRPVDAFVFIGWEKKSPYAHAVYELPPSIVEEGRIIMRNALNKYAECEKAGHWPGYPEGEVQELKFKPWAYEHVNPEAYDSETA